jgi:EAL domain-containing protein (putative c-di-GMP-specific phosphodiesterase class I)
MPEHRALDAILQPGGITPVFQPICAVFNGQWSITSFECLSRGPKGTNFESANVLFDYVRLKREETLVDRVCITTALAAAHALPPDTHLGLNVHASTLGRDPGFIDFLRATAENNDIAFNRLTIEIVEHAPPWDGHSFLAVLDRLRDLGAQIALDDVGLGQSNFKMLLDVHPDFMKIDRYFIERCAGDTNRQAVIEMVARLAHRFGASVVAEGVEDQATIDALKALDIGLMQGFFFSPPLETHEVAAFCDSATTDQKSAGYKPALQ